MTNLIIAAVDGQTMVHDVGVLLIVAICLLIVWLMGRYFFPMLSAPPIVLKIWDGFFVLIGGFFIINLLLGLVGHPLVRW